MKTRDYELQITMRADTDSDLIEGLEILLRNLKKYGARTNHSTGDMYVATWKCNLITRAIIRHVAGSARVERGEWGED